MVLISFSTEPASTSPNASVRVRMADLTLAPWLAPLDAHAKPLCDFANPVPALRHLLDRSNLDFLCAPLSGHTFSLRP